MSGGGQGHRTRAKAGCSFESLQPSVEHIFLAHGVGLSLANKAIEDTAAEINGLVTDRSLRGSPWFMLGEGIDQGLKASLLDEILVDDRINDLCDRDCDRFMDRRGVLIQGGERG